MYCFKDQIPEKDLGKGVILKVPGHLENLSVFHWDMADGSVVTEHSHPQEQFGYVIKGGFDMVIGGERATLGEGDSYFIPADVPHYFTAIGQTEAIDVFSPIRVGIPGVDA